MRTLRVLLGLAGLCAASWAAVLIVPVLGTGPDAVSLFTWLAGGPLLHDALLAPAVALAGLALARSLPPPWRGAVVAGLILTGVLVLLAIPLLWRPFAGPQNPGLVDRNYPFGLAIALAAVWVGVLAITAVRTAAHRKYANRQTCNEK